MRSKNSILGGGSRPLRWLKNMQRLLAMQSPRLADVNAANLIDITLMRKLEESGFFSQLQTRYRE